MEIRVFRNVCTHRGCELKDGSGNAKLLTCPYHAWTFALDGELLRIPEPHIFEGTDLAAHRLSRVRSDVWAGYVWFTLDPDAPSLKDYLGPAADELNAFPLASQVCFHRQSWDVDANWKAVQDNFDEPYHVGIVHAQSAARYADTASNVAKRLGLHNHFYFDFRNVPGSEASDTPEDTTATRVLATLPPGTSSVIHTYVLFPNMVLTPFGIYHNLIRPTPIDAHRTRLTLECYGIPPESDRERRQQESRRDFVAKVIEEDLIVLAAVQRGIESGAIDRIPLGKTEICIENHHRGLTLFVETASPWTSLHS